VSVGDETAVGRAKRRFVMTAKTRPFDPASYLNTARDVADYLDAVIEDALEHDDTSLIAAALGDVARAKSMHEGNPAQR